MNIPETIAYIAIGYFFVTLTLLYILSSRDTFSIEKRGGGSRKEKDTYKEDEEYLKAA
ncbi:MAG: hypothetical protein AABY41_02775 [Nitrospirota bacterium]